MAACHWIPNVTDLCDAKRCCASYVRRRGTHTRGPDDDPARGGVLFAECSSTLTVHCDCRGTMLDRSDAKHDRTAGRIEYGQ